MSDVDYRDNIIKELIEREKLTRRNRIIFGFIISTVLGITIPLATFFMQRILDWLL
jgi:hypothetical protein